MDNLSTLEAAEQKLAQLKATRFDLLGTNVIMGNNLNMMFAIPAEGAENREGAYAVITRRYSDGREPQVIRYDFADWTVRTGCYVISYKGLAAKEMIDEMAVVIYNSQDVQRSNTWTDRLKLAYRDLTADMDAVVEFTSHDGKAVKASIPGTAFERNRDFGVVVIENLVVAVRKDCK